MRLALKLATGAGKTTVMAMLIAWQTVNAVRHPGSKKFSRGFLIVTPGITIRDRLRVLLPNDPDSYYRHRELVPPDMLGDIDHAKIVITNYHAFKLRERMEVAKGTRSALARLARREAADARNRRPDAPARLPELMGMKNIVVLNDEAHHCYREKGRCGRAEDELKGEDKEEAEEEQRGRAALDLRPRDRQAQARRARCLRSLGDAVLPARLGLRRRHAVPLDDERLLADGRDRMRHRQAAARAGRRQHPRRRHADVPQPLGAHRHRRCRRRAAANRAKLDPLSLPVELQTALDALYGHYEKTFDAVEKAGIDVPPVFIVVCNNTSTSKLVYEYISGFQRENDDGSTTLQNGRLALFRNYDEFGNPLPRPNTLLIDSEQLESGEALDKDFRAMAADEIEQFRREIIERTGDAQRGREDRRRRPPREVMNTVGKKGRLGEQIRCVVSVSMLTEGWDANTVTHILGVRAFGTQLLCEQVVGRGLRRQSYDLNDEGLFNVEYADVPIPRSRGCAARPAACAR